MELQTDSNRASLNELSEIKKGCYKTYMVTYQPFDWIKAGAQLREEFMRCTPLPFIQTDQISPSILISSKWKSVYI